jgi:hypothetical protein
LWLIASALFCCCPLTLLLSHHPKYNHHSLQPPTGCYTLPVSSCILPLLLMDDDAVLQVWPAGLLPQQCRLLWHTPFFVLLLLLSVRFIILYCKSS